MSGPFVNALTSVRTWINEQPGVVGPYGPITKGAHLRRLRSPYKGAYIYLSRVGGSPDLSPESPVDRARISAQIYGITLEEAEKSAVVYANAIYGIQGAPVSMGDSICEFVTSITGPLEATIGDEPRYIVDAEFYLRSA